MQTAVESVITETAAALPNYELPKRKIKKIKMRTHHRKYNSTALDSHLEKKAKRDKAPSEETTVLPQVGKSALERNR